MHKLKRLLKGRYPDRHETWADYQARSSGAGIVAFAAVLAVTCLFLLAEIVGRA